MLPFPSFFAAADAADINIVKATRCFKSETKIPIMSHNLL